MVVKLNANRRRTGRARKKERSQAGAELHDPGAEQQPSEQNVEGPQEMESDKEKAEAELRSSEPQLILPALPEQPQQDRVEVAQPEPRKQSKQSHVVQPQVGQKSGGNRVADNREGMFEGFTKMGESVFSLDGVKKAAAWYIETSEKFANQALELQEKATGWAKDTPFAPLFEAQHSMARKFVERSANAARTLWQLNSVQ